MSCAGMIEGPLPFETTRDALLGGRLMLTQPRTGHRAGHAALLLAALAPAQARRIVDLGAGVGTAGLAVLAALPVWADQDARVQPALLLPGHSASPRLGVEDACGRANQSVSPPARSCRPFGRSVARFFAAASSVSVSTGSTSYSRRRETCPMNGL